MDSEGKDLNSGSNKLMDSEGKDLNSALPPLGKGCDYAGMAAAFK